MSKKRNVKEQMKHSGSRRNMNGQNNKERKRKMKDGWLQNRNKKNEKLKSCTNKRFRQSLTKKRRMLNVQNKSIWDRLRNQIDLSEKGSLGRVSRCRQKWSPLICPQVTKIYPKLKANTNRFMKKMHEIKILGLQSLLKMILVLMVLQTENSWKSKGEMRKPSSKHRRKRPP